MPNIERSIEILASPDEVWSIVADWKYSPKLGSYVLSTEADPPGTASVGQKIHQVARIGGRKIDLFSEVAEAERPKLLVTRMKPGSLFKAGSMTLTIQSTEDGSLVRFANEYELSFGYLGKVLNKLAIDRAARRSSDELMKNLKKIAELR